MLVSVTPTSVDPEAVPGPHTSPRVPKLPADGAAELDALEAGALDDEAAPDVVAADDDDPDELCPPQAATTSAVTPRRDATLTRCRMN
jgi:hypothetical protein